MTFTISMEDHATPAILEMLARTKDRTQLHRALGKDVEVMMKNYVRVDKEDRHETADRLGAPHSNFVAGAVEAIALKEANKDWLRISLNHPYFARAFGDVTITPKKTYLTIPLIAAAYNQRAPTIQGLFFWTSASGKSFLASALKAPGVKGTIELWYLLLKIVHQAMDRSRLPSDGQIVKTCVESGNTFYTQLIQRFQAAKVARGTQ